MRYILTAFLLSLAFTTSAQTDEEQIATLRAISKQALAICKTLDPATEGCHVFIEPADPVTCPDPLAATRTGLQDASAVINQVLAEHPAP